MIEAIDKYDCIIVGSGPAGLGAALYLNDKLSQLRILVIDKANLSSGGLRNDCKMNFTFPVGFPNDCWTRENAEHYLQLVEKLLVPNISTQGDLSAYRRRAKRLQVSLLDIRQCHLGTDGGIKLIKQLMADLERRGITLVTKETALSVDVENRLLSTDKRQLHYGNLLLAPGRGGFRFVQQIMQSVNIPFVDNIVDIGFRLEMKQERYPIIADCYDPKFHFPEAVRTFCTNSGAAYVVKEKYTAPDGKNYFSLNGHSYSKSHPSSGLVNFALLKTVHLTQPLASGQEYAEMLSRQAMLLGGGKPLMQRVGDFRLGKRSKAESFNDDLFDFTPSLAGCAASDISLAVPGKILRNIWNAMKLLDTIIPGVLHPSTIMYYPEIKLYANKPVFNDNYFRAAKNLYLIGDGAGTSRGITAAWASGIRAADGILQSLSRG